MSAALTYSGLDRHSFGLERQPELRTLPDPGPWPWDRTGTAEDTDGWGERLPRLADAKPRCRKQPDVRNAQTPTSLARNWILGLPGGTSFPTSAALQASGRPAGRDRTLVTQVLQKLKRQGHVVNVAHGTWRRL